MVHAPSIAMADGALAMGLAFFKRDLLHVARGFDVAADGDSVDWHHVLLTRAFDRLPEDVRRFTRSRELPSQGHAQGGDLPSSLKRHFDPGRVRE